MTATTLLLLADGCRRDYLTADNAPFLHGLTQRALVASLEAPPGYGHRASLLTGTYPDTSSTFTAFAYEPERSPFRWTRKLGPASRIYQGRKMLFPFRAAIKAVSRHDPAWIPGAYLSQFSAVREKPVFAEGAFPQPSLFDLLRAQGRPFRYIGAAKDDAVQRSALAALRERAAGSVVVAHLSALDRAGHEKGPILPETHARPPSQTDADRAAMRRAVRVLDEKARALHDALSNGGDDWRFVLVGDHGMAPVMQKVNLVAELGDLPVKAGRDYTIFVNSTMASFWFHTERGEQEIVDHLTNATCGRIVSTNERKERRIPTDRRFGELLFAADPGVLFWPDYFHALERDLKGMHGYLDKKLDGADSWGAEGAGILIVDEPSPTPRDLGLRALVDVLPTLCRLTDLDVPPTNEGRSLLEESHAIAA